MSKHCRPTSNRSWRAAILTFILTSREANGIAEGELIHFQDAKRGGWGSWCNCQQCVCPRVKNSLFNKEIIRRVQKVTKVSFLVKYSETVHKYIRSL